MSGLVAKRLFDLLPRRMPLQVKYTLVKKLWDHCCPKSQKVFYIDHTADLNTLADSVGTHLEKQVRDYYISEDLAQRFDWLAAGDVHVKQQLENYFQQLKKANMGEALRARLQLLKSHLSQYPEDHRIQEVRIGNHVVEIRFSKLANGVSDESAVAIIRQECQRQEHRRENAKALMWLAFWIVMAIILLRACAR